MSETTEQENVGRNPDGTFKLGVSGNPGGRPRNSLKDYVKRMLNEMTDEEKKKWLKENNVSGEIIWRMGEGNPAQATDITTDGKPLPTPIFNGLSSDNRNSQNLPAQEKN